jgi:hypothetical protein
MGMKTKQWIVTDGTVPYPEIFRKLEVAKAIERILNKMEGRKAIVKRGGETDYFLALVEAKKALKDEVAETIMVEEGKCPEGRMWNGERDIGHFACLKCPHLRPDEGPLGPDRKSRFHWLCGVLLREVMVARKMADR